MAFRANPSATCRDYGKAVQHRECWIDYCPCGNAGEGADIILLGEHSLVVLDTQGQLRLQKRFDYQPVAFTTYPVRQQLLISVQSTTSMLAFVMSHPFLHCIW